MKDTSILTGNGIRTGAQYISGLQDDREVWTQGKRIKMLHLNLVCHVEYLL